MNRSVLLPVVCAVLLWGCGKPSAQEYLARGQQAEKAARAAADTLLDRSAIAAAYAPVLKNYRELVASYPNDPLAPDAMFLIATIEQNNLRNPDAAVESYKKFTGTYPDAPKAPLAMFLVAYVYNNEIGNTDSARVWYTRFLERYPANDMAQSAQFELNNLGKTPDELLSAKVAAAPATKGSTDRQKH
jgi:tetratricopeptide (TPR) repeat protein